MELGPRRVAYARRNPDATLTLVVQVGLVLNDGLVLAVPACQYITTYLLPDVYIVYTS